MRPLKLTMQAFGPFLKKVIIPFENLDKCSLYLITGKTGSGKTTIFDAISFALFNQSSGYFRGTNSFRSHYADDKFESFVEFAFEHNGEIYTVIRTPFYERKKQKGEGFISINSKAQLTLPNSKLVIGVKEVDTYIEQLLGINGAQFGQIALLAQGEFLKILNSDTQKRGEIFRSIFKTKIYSDFSLSLKKEFDLIKLKHSELKKSILQYISQIDLKNENIISYVDKYLNNNCIFNVDEFVLVFENEISNIQVEIKKIENILFKINKETKQNDLIILKVDEKNVLKKDIDAYCEKISVVKKEHSIVKAEYDKLSDKKDLLDSLKIKIDKSNNLLKKLDQLFECQNELNKINLLKSGLEFEISKVKNEYLENYGKYIVFLRRQLESKQKEFILLQENYSKRNAEYVILNNKFLSMQAGILAFDLKENLPCPVCGSVKHPKPAKLTEDISYEFVKNAKFDLDCASENLSKVSLQCSLIESDLNLVLNNFNVLLGRFSIQEYNYDIAYSKLVEKEEFEKRISEFEDKILKKENQLNDVISRIMVLNSSIEIFNKEFDEIDINEARDYNLKIKLEAEKLENEILLIEKNYMSSKDNLADLMSKLEISQERYSKIDFCSVEIDEIRNKNKLLLADLEKYNLILKKLEYSYSLNKDLCERIKSVSSEFKILDEKYPHYKILSDLANGSLNGKPKIAFEQYIQAYYLDLIIFEANKRLRTLTKNQFQLLRKKDTFSRQSKTGLDIEVMDFHTFKTRSTKTLSGGESFKAALCLALGLSDVVSCFSGAISIDSLFIDEGFGSLDVESLELAMDVISALSESGRQIGIISHVEDLKNRIENKIIVHKGDLGSSLEINF